VARGFIPVRLRSSRKPLFVVYLMHRSLRFGAALRPNGDKSPRHNSFHMWICVELNNRVIAGHCDTPPVQPRKPA
jgi:hypothetical protein